MTISHDIFLLVNQEDASHRTHFYKFDVATKNIYSRDSFATVTITEYDSEIELNDHPSRRFITYTPNPISAKEARIELGQPTPINDARSFYKALHEQYRFLTPSEYIQKNGSLPDGVLSNV